MAEGDIGYRFKNHKWEVWDGANYVPVGPETAALLRDYTQVKDIGQGRLVFYAQNGDTMTEDVLLNQIEQMDEADRVANAPWWGPEITAAFGPYFPEHPNIPEARAYAEQLGIPGATGATELNKGSFQTIAEADAAAPPGWHSVGNANGSYTLERDAPKKPVEQPTFEEEFNRLIFAGQDAKAEALWKARERITSNGGRMTYYQAAQLLLGDDLFKAEEIPGLLQALMGPQEGQGSFQAAMEDARLPGPQGQPGNVNIGGFYGPTQPEKPFPAFPDTLGTGPVPGGVSPAIPASFGATANPNAVLANYQATKPAQAPPVADIFAEAARVASFKGLTPEQYDERYADSSPEAQAQIRAALAKEQVGGANPSQEGQTGFQLTESPDFMAALRKRETELRGPIGPGDIGAGATPGPAGQVAPPQTFQQAYEAQGGAARQGVFQVPQGMNPWDAAAQLGQTSQGLATTAAINAVTPEARAQMAQEAQASPGYVGAPQQAKNPFAQALAEINQRITHRRLLRQPQGRNLFV